MSKLKLIIMVGNVGAGKSVLARQLFEGNPEENIVVNMDSIQSLMSGGLYTYYDENKKTIYSEVENLMIDSALNNGYNVIIDRTNMEKKRRARFIEIGKKYNCEFICFDYGKGNDKHYNRRLRDKRGVQEDVLTKVYLNFKDVYEEPTKEEGFDTIIRMN